MCPSQAGADSHDHPPNKCILLEVCADSVRSCVEAERGGAQRIELCANLVEGGTTPSYGLIKQALKTVKIPINVLVRPRGGDFLYTDDEMDVMKQDISACKELGVSGVVIGVLLPDGQIDVERTNALLKLARPLSVTFHRAFDMTSDPEQGNTLNDRLLKK